MSEFKIGQLVYVDIVNKKDRPLYRVVGFGDNECEDGLLLLLKMEYNKYMQRVTRKVKETTYHYSHCHDAKEYVINTFNTTNEIIKEEGYLDLSKK